jgi:hypothetical protein
MEDRITAHNNNELHILPQVEEIGNLAQKLYRLVQNIMTQPEDVKHIHSLISSLEEKIVSLKSSTEGYEIDTDLLNEKFDRQVEVPQPPDDGKERVYWGPEDMAELKDQIVQEVVSELRPEPVAIQEEPVIDNTPDVEVSQVIEEPQPEVVEEQPRKRRRRGGRSNQPIQQEVPKKKPVRRGKRAFKFDKEQEGTR